MTLTMKLAGVVTGLGLALSVAGQAHATDLTFYYPVAVGGPVTKVIDGMAADFEKANTRSETRRVGKEGVSTCRSRGSPDHYKNTLEKQAHITLPLLYTTESRHSS